MIVSAKDSKQLTFMYLANDVIQNSKKKGPEYGHEFGEVLVDSFKHMAKTGINTKTKHSLHRILGIWGERGVYDAQKIQEYKEAGKYVICFFLLYTKYNHLLIPAWNKKSTSLLSKTAVPLKRSRVVRRRAMP
jgi:hypothetical protein